jgi:mannosyltransferase
VLRLRYAAVGALLIQSVLLFSHPGMLPMWGDELFTLLAVREPLPEMFGTLQRDVHPPLFFLAERYWIRLPLTADPVTRLRLLAALFALAASAYALWFLLPRLSARAGYWFCALLAISPCLILYGRMARSYSLQLLVSLIAIHQLLRLLKNPRETRLAIAFGLGSALVLYTHYTPGVAIAIAGSAALLIRTRTLRPLVLPNVVMLVAYSPWIASSLIAVGRWGNKSAFSRVSGSAVLEEIIKLGYWSVSLLFGESIPWWLFLVEIPLGLGLAWLAWRGLASAQEWILPLAIVAILGYLSVSRWVTYPFIPSRMLFLLPFLYLLLANGFEARPERGRLILSAMLLTSALGLWSYFHAADFLNWGYAVPYTEISQEISSSSRPTLVATGVFTDSSVLGYILPPDIPFRSIEPQTSVEQAVAELSAGPWSRVCLVRNTHDASPGGYYIRLEEALARNFPRRETHFYRPRTRLDNMLMRELGLKDEVPYFYEVVEFER